MAGIKQYGILVLALAIGGGFAFGGIASYAGITGGGSQNTPQEEFNATMPQNQFSADSFGLGPREQLTLAVRNDIVFVNGIYETQQQKQEMQQYQELTERFERVYVSLTNSSEPSDIKIQYGLTEFPRTIVVGGNRNYRSQPFSEISVSKAESEICNSFRSLSFEGKTATSCLNR